MIYCCVSAWFIFLFAFFIGAIPTGPIIAWLKGVNNLHERGSGNTGATNVGRALGLFYFFIVFAIDAGKAYGCLWLLDWLGYSCDNFFIAPMALMLGNIRSPFLFGKGGKGVSSAVGILSFTAPALLPWLFACWALVLIIVRRVGIASVAASLLLFFFGWRALSRDMDFGVGLMVLAIVIIWRHRTNISEYWRSWYGV